ncbi:MAG: hypothetical protein WC900_08770 [Oscillospiraceae bacterium]|jgi:hypothetical protein
MNCPEWLLDAMKRDEPVDCWVWNNQKADKVRRVVYGFELLGFPFRADGGVFAHAEPYKEPEHEFKPFEKVLVRDKINQIWSTDFFERHINRSEFSYCCMTDSWEYCIPYEGNEEFLGSTNNPE